MASHMMFPVMKRLLNLGAVDVMLSAGPGPPAIAGPSSAEGGKSCSEHPSCGSKHWMAYTSLPYGNKTLSLQPFLNKNIDMNNFAAIDFETANECSSSVCSVGVVIVRDGEVADSFYSLIHPEPEYYKWFCRQVHGLGPEDTEDAPVFPEVWEKIAPLIEGLPLVAHNSRFDEKCLKSVFNVYRMDYPDYEFYDTLAASRRHFGCQLPNHQLQTVASACGYDLTDHHHALADAEACAAIALKIL
mgnify:CR=1 FL=1